MANNRRSLLSSEALIQAPWVKVTFGEANSGYTFGVYSKNKVAAKNAAGFYNAFALRYPNYISSLTIVKINGQVNQYTLVINYPVKPTDDPNYFEKIFSATSKTRKIIFSYGDSNNPSYCYKDEEAIITNIKTGFSFGNSGTINSVITYTISAISSAALGKTGSFTFLNTTKKKPSDEIKRIFKNKSYGLQDIFTGMGLNNIDDLIASDDKAVQLSSKTNISPLDYIAYLVGCMVPANSTKDTTSKDIYILTLHDDTVYDKIYNDTRTNGGPYFKVTKTSYAKSQSDAYEVDIGYNTKTIVTAFNVNNQENYSLYYDYAGKLYPEDYTRRLNNNGEWEEIYTPIMTSNNQNHKTMAEDIAWYTKITQFPISANITIQGLLRPATLMQYLRLNVIFPGGIGDKGERKHISSGLYIVTKQTDTINEQGYRTTLELTKINGDNLGGKN